MIAKRFTSTLRWTVASLAALGCASSLRAADTINTLSKGAQHGSITAITKYEVTLKRGDFNETIPTSQIASMRFEGEPAQLNLARSAVDSGRYEEAARLLDKLKDDKIERPEVRVEIDFLRSATTARLALTGQGDLREAGRAMTEFVKANPDTYRYLSSVELLGDLLVAVKAYGKAAEQYALLEVAPYPEIQLRGAVARGRALRAQGKLDEAGAAFSAALAKTEGATEPAVVAARQEAQLGSAEILAGSGKSAEALTAVESIIATGDAEDARLMARAYNALGACQRQSGQPKAALLAYLHTDLLYFTQPDAHAEALANLAQLWNELREPERAAEAQQMLKDRYPNSAWAK